MAGASSGLKARWQEWSARFAALQQREKVMVAGAVAVAILFGGLNLWIDPGTKKAAQLKKAIAQQQTELGQLTAQIAALGGKNTDPDAGNRVQLQQLREQLVATERDLKMFDGSLVAPAQAPALLQTLLARHRGLSLLSLNTLPPQPLIDWTAKKPAKDGAKANAAKDSAPKEEAVSMPGGNIYKHGIEIKLAGNYSDLLAYVAELEAGPQKLLWGGMQFNVKQHPVSELTLTVYTLSLDVTWLVV